MTDTSCDHDIFRPGTSEGRNSSTSFVRNCCSTLPRGGSLRSSSFYTLSFHFQPLTFKGLTSLRSVCCIYQVSQRSASLIFNLFFSVCVIQLHFSQFCCPRAMSDRYPALNKNLKMYQRLPHPYYTHINTYKG